LPDRFLLGGQPVHLPSASIRHSCSLGPQIFVPRTCKIQKHLLRRALLMVGWVDLSWRGHERNYIVWINRLETRLPTGAENLWSSNIQALKAAHRNSACYRDDSPRETESVGGKYPLHSTQF
jgi:hypothetical protein